MIILYYTFLYLFINKNKKYIMLYLLIFVININSRLFIFNQTITYLDVGQGDSSVIILPHGKTVLIDTGGLFNSNYSLAKDKIIPYLNSKGINRIDALILTHGDFDHMGEAINLVNNFRVEKVIFNCGEFNDLEKELIKVLDKKKIKYYSCIKELNIDNNKLYFLQTKEYDNENDNSNVIYTELNGYKFMFMGDAGVDKEKDIIEEYNLKNIDVLKVGHHGSKTSSSKYFINKICGKFIFAPRIMICIPSQVTEVEKKAVIDAASQAGARKVYLIEEPIAAAIGAGIDISKPCGNMVVDIGGGTTDIAVISLGGSVVSTSLKVAGDKFDEYIVKYIKKKHNIAIGERTAEDLKINVGCVYPKIQDTEMDIRGRDLITGLPKTITIKSSEMMEALAEPAMMIVDAVHSTLERTPPELAADISDRGIYMTGGGCLVDGLDKLLQEQTGINVMIAEDAVSCVALGTGKALDNLDVLDGKTKR